MRGRKPQPLMLRAEDAYRLCQIARSQSLPWLQVQRARIVVARAAGERTKIVADRLECDEATIRRACTRYQTHGMAGLLADGRKGHSGRPARFPPVQRAQIVALACLEPIARGLHITHWSCEDLARQAAADGIVPTISARTIGRILDAVDLQPHRTRYWRTSRLDAQFKERAERVLWCYAQAPRLARRGIWVVCADEMPNRQVLERVPIRRAIPGSIEQQEFDYIRHGTVNILTFLIVHTGEMAAVCLEANDAEHYVPALMQFRHDHRRLRGIYLVHDGGPSHTSHITTEYLASCRGWWRPRFTPTRGSWLDQAELLNHAFDLRYLKRGSWKSRAAYIEHVMSAWPEYNKRYAHPFEWTWTTHKMRRWYAEHAS